MIDSEKFWFKRAQLRAFADEIGACKGGKPLPKGSPLVGLVPMLGEDGLLRVGGRLQHAPMPLDQRHPIILPGNDTITTLLLRKFHKTLMHGGPQVMMRLARRQFWITGGRNVFRKSVQRCVICVRHRGRTMDQRMAPLRVERVTGGYPFLHASIDYCGPFEVKAWKDRCNRIVKCYVAVFICMATRAIHLEVVEGLSTADFIDAYQRFASRRGHCKSIKSDNATNFVGAKRKLDQVLETWKKAERYEVFSTRGIEWTFTMPRSPSQGGNHEAAVKLYKHHLVRMMGARRLSLSEFVSLTTRIEACLNSRPLGVQYDDPTDHIVLTPAHFLIGREFENVAVDEPADDGKTFAYRWRKVQHMHQQFWASWQRDYINALQSRNKWINERHDLEINDIVLIKEDGIPPQQWMIGRVSKLHPGNDGLVRNVTITRMGKDYKRAVQKLCKLPVTGQEEI